jgi:hypothetical protein
MMEDVESGKVGIVVMKDMTRRGRDYLQVGNAMETFRRNNVRFIAINHGIDSADPNTLEFAPFINIMSEWYAKDISKKVKTGITTKGMSGKPIATEAPYGYIKDPDNKDYWLIDEEAARVIRLIFRLFMDGKNRNQIAVFLKNEQISFAVSPIQPIKGRVVFSRKGRRENLHPKPLTARIFAVPFRCRQHGKTGYTSAAITASLCRATRPAPPTSNKEQDKGGCCIKYLSSVFLAPCT